MSTARDYRLSAGQCRRRADAAANEASKATWLKFAEEWTKLSDEAEQADPGTTKKTTSSAKSS